MKLAEAFSTYQLMEKLASTNHMGGVEAAQPLNAEQVAAEAGQLTTEELLEVVDKVRNEQGVNIEPEVAEEPVEDTPRGESSRPAPSVGGSGGGVDAPKSTPAGKSTGASAAKTSGGAAGKIWGAATAPVRAVGDVAITASNKAHDLLNSITTKERTNKAQRNTDLSVEDVRRAINIRRMIATDDVLREADPREVLEIYNSVSRLNPEIAHNMPAVKLLLREAVSYEGLTLDAQKQLTDIRKGTGESEAKEYDNDKRRYTAGGALPIGGQSRKA